MPEIRHLDLGPVPVAPDSGPTPEELASLRSLLIPAAADLPAAAALTGEELVTITQDGVAVQKPLGELVSGVVRTMESALTSITLIDAHSGYTLRTTAATAVTLIVPATLGANFNLMVFQEGAGRVTFVADSGAVIRAYGDMRTTAGQYAMASLLRVRSVDHTYALGGMLS
jgi:hypothetical protein